MNERGKRLFDLVLRSLAVVVLSPIMAIVAIVVRVAEGEPILFKQVRTGLGGSPFVIYKFRSMSNLVDESGRPRADGDRLSAVGRVLRSTSLDELPTLVNVLGGEMSLVGPRPLLPEYLDLYTAEQRRRHEVRPGITGLAQVQGRNSLEWTEKFELDVYYVQHQTLACDLNILLRTLLCVGRREGISRCLEGQRRQLSTRHPCSGHSRDDSIVACHRVSSHGVPRLGSSGSTPRFA